jgi:hypothetical protein
VERQLCPDFGSIPWSDLQLRFIVSFDSNVGEGRKPELNLAVSRLASEMDRLGVVTYLSQLPPPPEGDWGIDDYYADHGEQAVHDLFTDDKLVKVDGDVVQHLKILNREVGYVESVDRVVRLAYPELTPMTISTFKTGAYANRVHWGVDAKGKHKKIKLANEWLDWADRRNFYDMVYEPGSPAIIDHEIVGRNDEGEVVPLTVQRYNLWRPSHIEPERCDEWTALWEEWLVDAFPNEEERHWFCCWWAYQMQEVGTKMSTALVLLGESGVGKGWVTQIMKTIYGHRNCAASSLQELAGGFNSQFTAKQLVVVEEAEMPTRSDGLHAKLKDLITNPKLSVNTKGVPVYEIDNHLNLFIQSNNVDALHLDSFDRRYAIFDIVNPKLSKGGGDYWTLRWEALKLGLPEAVLDWLLEYDCGDFDPDGVAIQTAVKQTVHDVGLNAREQFVDMLKHEPDNVLPDQAALYTAAQLEYLYLGTGEDPSPNQNRTMSRTLAKQRIKQVTDAAGSPSVMRGPDNKPARWWVIREVDIGQVEADPKQYMSSINMAKLK